MTPQNLFKAFFIASYTRLAQKTAYDCHYQQIYLCYTHKRIYSRHETSKYSRQFLIMGMRASRWSSRHSTRISLCSDTTVVFKRKFTCQSADLHWFWAYNETLTNYIICIKLSCTTLNLFRILCIDMKCSVRTTTHLVICQDLNLPFQ